MPAVPPQSEVAKLLDVLVSFPPEEQETLAAYYRAEAEHIRDVPRRLDDLPEKQAARLRATLQEGIDSGEGREIDAEAIKRRGRERLASERRS